MEFSKTSETSDSLSKAWGGQGPCLGEHDPAVAEILQEELERQRCQIEMIASENFTSLNVLEAQGSVLTNKYAEGYPGRRYYGGCESVDKVEILAQERAKSIFGCAFANVQPHSGSQANQGVFAALMEPGDVFLGMGMGAGGHLTHGASVNISGKWFQAVSYGVRASDELIDLEQVEALAQAHKPRLIIAGGSAYARIIDFKAFRDIADAVGASFMVDMAHFAGLVAGGVYPSPFPHAHVVTSTTHKTLRGPRGGLILTNDESLSKKLNGAIFPGLQGGPFMHSIAAKAVAFGEIQQESFAHYAHQVVKNAQVLAQTLQKQGLRIVSGGTDSHLCVVDVSPLKITGQEAENILDHAGITCNKNGIPFDPLPPMKASGIRLGSPAATTRGLKEEDFKSLGLWIVEVLKAHSLPPQEKQYTVERVRNHIQTLCARHPLYPSLRTL